MQTRCSGLQHLGGVSPPCKNRADRFRSSMVLALFRLVVLFAALPSSASFLPSQHHWKGGVIRSTSAHAQHKPRSASGASFRQERGFDTLNDVEAEEGARVQDDSSLTNRAVATVAYLWWTKHKEQHNLIPPQDVEILYHNGTLGGGAYGEVFRAVVRDRGRWVRAVAKRARDGSFDPEDPSHANNSRPDEATDNVSWEEFLEMWDMHNQSFHFLQVEAFINDIVKESCQHIAAPYLGTCRKRGVRWLVWEDMGGVSLQDLLDQAAKNNTLHPLADAFKLENHTDKDPASHQRLVNVVARQLLQCCVELEAAGLAHRDVKPANLLVANGRLRLIDFGAAAAMSLPGMAGYDRGVAPCDESYAPPEQFIDEEAWAGYDAYSAGLTVLRILLPPLWSGWNWNQFVDTFAAAGHDLDRWLLSIAEVDAAVQSAAPSRWARMLERLGVKQGLGQRYVDLADESRTGGAGEGALNMGSMLLGLEVLGVPRGGVSWEVLRGLLARSPHQRMSVREAVARLEEDKVVEWAVWRERRAKLRAWKAERKAEAERERKLEEGLRSGMVKLRDVEEVSVDAMSDEFGAGQSKGTS